MVYQVPRYLSFFFFCFLSVYVTAQDLKVNLDLGAEPHGFVHDSARDLLYISVPSTHEIIQVSTVDYRIIDTFILPDSPMGMDISDDGNHLFAALNHSGSVAVIDLLTKAVRQIDVALLLGAGSTWDVEYVAGDRLFVSANPGSSGFAYIVEIRLAEGDAAQRVAGNSIIREEPVFAEQDGHFLYVGEGFSPNSLYKLDLSQDSVPLILEDVHGSVYGSDKLAISPFGDRIHTTAGQVFRTESLTQTAEVNPGLTDYLEDNSQFYLAEATDFFGYESRTVVVSLISTSTYLPVHEWEFDCVLNDPELPSDFMVLPGQTGFLLLANRSLCGLISDTGGLDLDADGVIDTSDNCPQDHNPDQLNSDDDELGDVCDPYPLDDNNLMACLIDLDGQELTIEEQTRTIVNLNQTIYELNQTIAGRDQTISDLNQTVASLEQSIDQLNLTIVSRDQSISDLNQTVASQAQTIDALNQTIVGRDQTISDLNQTVASQGQTIDELNQTIVSRDQTISDLNQTVASQGQTIDELTAENQALREEIDRLLNPPPPEGDADGDGVPDSQDLCPGTTGGKVDADGCSRKQR